MQEISERTGESMASLYDRISKGTMSVDEITQAMVTATSEGGKFYQSMEKQSQTLNGQLSTLSDNCNELLGSITSGMSEELAGNLLPAVNEMIGQLQSAFDSNGMEGLMNTATDMIPDLLDMLSGKLESGIAALSKWAPKAADGLMKALPGAIKSATSAIPQITSALFSVASTVVTDLVGMLPELIPQVIDGVVNMIGSIFTGASDMLVGLYDGIEKIFHQGETKILGEWVSDDALAQYDYNISVDVSSEVTNNTDAETVKQEVQGAVNEISDALKGVEGIDADSVAKAIISGDTTSALSAALTLHGLDLASAEQVAADITSAQQSISTAIEGLGLSEEAQTKLNEMAADESTTAADIETYLTDMGIDPQVATDAATTITTGRDQISSAISSLPEEVQSAAAESLIGGYTTRGLMKWSLGLMGVPESTQNEVLNSYDTFSSTLSGKITGVYEDIEKTLTDGLADTPKSMDGLKTQVETWATEAHGKIAEWYNAAVANLDTTDADYAQQILALQERRDALDTAVNDSVTNTTKYVNEMGGKSTEYVQEHLNELESLAEQAGVLSNEIDALGGKVTTQGEQDFNVVRAGATKDEATISSAITFTFSEYKLDEQAAEDAYNQAIAELKEKLGSNPTDAEVEQYKQDEAALQAEKEAAIQAAIAKRDQMIGEILAGVADAGGTSETLSAAAEKFSMAQYISDMLTQSVETDEAIEIPESVRASLEEALAGEFGKGLNLDPSALGSMGSEGMNSLLMNYAQYLFDNANSSLEGVDTSNISACVQQMLEAGVLEGSSLAAEGADMATLIQMMFPAASETDLASTGEDYTGEVASGVESNEGAVTDAGDNTVGALNTSLSNGIDSAARIGAKTAKAYVRAYRRNMEIQSPSKVMQRLGNYTGQGLEQGLTSSMERAKKVAARLSGEISSATTASLTQTTRVTVPNLAQEITIANEQSATPVTLDGKQIASIQGQNNRRQLAFERARTARGYGY